MFSRRISSTDALEIIRRGLLPVLELSTFFSVTNFFFFFHFFTRSTRASLAKSWFSSATCTFWTMPVQAIPIRWDLQELEGSYRTRDTGAWSSMLECLYQHIKVTIQIYFLRLFPFFISCLIPVLFFFTFSLIFFHATVLLLVLPPEPLDSL